MKKESLRVLLALGSGLALALSWLWWGSGLAARAAGASELHVCPSGCAYSSIQAAVDAAHPGDTIKVAQGAYRDVHYIPAMGTSIFTPTQVVAVNKNLTIRGGYTTTDWNTPDPQAHPTILDAEGLGRVLVISGTTTATIEGLRITGGNAFGLGGLTGSEGIGGGIYLVNATAAISDNQIFGNKADFGGGLCLYYSDAQVSHNTVYSNTANHGDGLYLDTSPATLIGNVIRNNGDNATGWGGGMYLANSNAALYDNIVINNTGGYGGGINIQRSEAMLVRNTITGNSAYRGGGVFLYVAESLLQSNLVARNSAIDQGGGIWLWADHSQLVNTVIMGNHLASQASLGAGLYLDNKSASNLLHNTIADNTGGDGSGVYVTGIEWAGTYYASSVTLINNILVNHTLGLMVTTGNTATLNATLWHANGADWGGAGAFYHANDHTGSPLFASDGYHLLSGSAAIDKGVDSGVTIDIDGEPRPIKEVYDLGADEWPATYAIYLPLVKRSE